VYLVVAVLGLCAPWLVASDDVKLKICNAICASQQASYLNFIVQDQWTGTSCDSLHRTTTCKGGVEFGCILASGAYQMPPNDTTMCDWDEFKVARPSPPSSPPSSGVGVGAVSGDDSPYQYCLHLDARNQQPLMAIRAGTQWSMATCSRLSGQLGLVSGVTADTRYACIFGDLTGGSSISLNNYSPPPRNCGWSGVRATDNTTNPNPVSEARVCLSASSAGQRFPTMGFSVPVNQKFSGRDCLNLVRNIGGKVPVLGCVFTDTFSLGAAGGSFPDPNCGW